MSEPEKYNLYSIKKSEEIKEILSYLNQHPNEIHEKFATLDHKSISKLYYHDVLSCYDLPNRRKEVYQKYLSESEMFELSLKSYLQNGQIGKFMIDHKNPVDTEDKEKILMHFLTSSEFEINEDNAILLRESPVVLSYFLSDTSISNERKLELLLIDSSVDATSPAPEPASDKLLDEIYYSFINLYSKDDLNLSDNMNNNFITPHYNSYIVLAGLKNGSLSLNPFKDNCFSKMNTVHLKNIKLIFDVYSRHNMAYDNKFTDLFIYQLSKNNYYNNGDNTQLELFLSISKMLKFSSLAYSQQNHIMPIKNLQELGLINNEDLVALNRDVGNSINSNINIDDILNDLNLDVKPASLEEALILIKDKKAFELSIAESNVLLALTHKILKENNIDGYDLLFNFDGILGGYGACINSRQKNIEYTISSDNIRQLVYNLFHEINHAVQTKNCEEMNFEKEVNLIDFCKDEIIRYIDDTALYYDINYHNISFEFDADFKAYMQTQAIFGECEETFQEALEKYKQISNYEDYSIRIFQDGKKEPQQFANIDTCFGIILKSLYKKNKNKYRKLIKIIKSKYPIIEYEYDLEIAEARSINQLLDMAQSYDEKIPHEAKKANAIKHIIQYRCNPQKVGETQAKENAQLLEYANIEEKLRNEILESKTNYQKYSQLFDELKQKSSYLKLR